MMVVRTRQEPNVTDKALLEARITKVATHTARRDAV